MRITPFLPTPPLDRFVELVWTLHGTPDYSREKVLPNGAVELIVNLGSPHKVVDRTDPGRFTLYRRAWVAGLQREWIVIEAVRESHLLGVRFRPGGAYPFLHRPMAELTDRVVECDALLGRLADELRERLLAAADDRERVRRAEAVLRSRLDPDLAPEPWLAWALGELRRVDPAPRVGELARTIGVSQPTLVRRFRQRVGVAPKRLARIHRLQAVIARAARSSRPDWAGLAAACGFTDQPHLNREFRALTGSSPGEYLARRDADVNHVIVD